MLLKQKCLVKSGQKAEKFKKSPVNDGKEVIFYGSI